MTNEEKPCRRRAQAAQKAAAAQEREAVVEMASAPEAGRVLPDPQEAVGNADFVADQRRHGYCGTCGVYIGRGRVLHENACRRKKGLPP